MDTVDTRSTSVPEDGKKIIEIQLERLRTFKNHPFKVRMDPEMIRLSASVEKYGIINPLIVRPIPDGVYEIISGHRRKAAAEKFGYRKVLRLNQILLNIVSNAIKFTPVGGIVNIRVSEKPYNKKGFTTFEFRIRDNGIGMSEEFQAHVFDSFSRERSSTQSGIKGTGLGMAITRNIVDMMGGTISLTSKEGKGTEFVVTLNFKTLEKATVYGPIPELVGARALVVDDDVHTCTSVSKMLREIEMRADWSTSGKEAVIRAKEAFEQNDAFKAYIIDWLMPDMNGIETVRRIRAVIGDETPIIILTAYDWADIEQEAKEAGVTAFVEKPIFMSELRKVLTKPMEIKEETLQQTRTLKNNKKANIPIVAMTANALKKTKRRHLKQV